MRRLALRSAAISCVVALSISTFTDRVFASPMPPLIWAVTSNNGQFLVVSTLKATPANEGGGARKVLGATFEINARETFAYTKGRLTAPNHYYRESFDGWKVELPGKDALFAQWPIISDDGTTLILVSVNPPVPGMTLLAIYKKHGRVGQLLRRYTVEDLWNLKKPVDVKMYTILDSTPEWFDDGQFSFSDLGQTLLYIDKEHGAIRFSLKDGAVTKGE